MVNKRFGDRGGVRFNLTPFMNLAPIGKTFPYNEEKIMNFVSRIRNFSAIAAISAAAAFAAQPAAAQLKPWEDYEPSDGVWEMTLVDLDEGTFEIYLEGLKSTWIAGNEVAKELGHIQDYAIYASQYGAADAFDLVLVIQYDSTDDIGPSKERYDAFLAEWGQANIDKSNKKVLDLYNKIRRIKGTYLLREITVK